VTYSYAVPGKKEKLPLSVTHPELAKEADGWDPSDYLAGSNFKKSWRCKFDHRWSTAICTRTRGAGCPFCSGREAIVGETDLQTLFPVISSEAYGWDPSTVTASSGKKLQWKCSKDHIWTAAVYSRKNGTGCPYCSGHRPIVGETDLLTLSPLLSQDADGWDPRLFTKHSGAKLKWKCSKGHMSTSSIDNRQKTGCPYCSGYYPIIGETDLLTVHPKIAAEADGWNPSEFLPKSNQIKPWICAKGHKYKAQICTRTDIRSTGNGCPFCSGRRVISGETDLKTINPELASQAYGWDPNEVSPGSESKLKWKCIRGHIWEAAVYSRNANVGCPFCANKRVLKGFNDLATTEPDLAREASGWDPTTVTSGSSHKSFLWKCHLGHSWRSNVKNRTKGQGCPTCHIGGFDPNAPSFLYFLTHKDWGMLQIGITNKPEIRLGTHKRLGWELQELRGPMDGHLTQQWETAILRMLKAKGADLSNSKIAGKFDGYSEAWSKATFEVKSIKELMRLTEEFEEEI
jgi:hypothetical protein